MEILQRLTFSIVQGSSNAFEAIELATGLLPENGRGIELVNVRFDFESSPIVLAGSTVDLLLQLTKSVQTAEVFESGNDLIAKWKRYQSATSVVAEGLILDLPVDIPIEKPILVVSPEINIAFDTGQLTAAQTVNGVIEYRSVKVPEVDILRILQA